MIDSVTAWIWQGCGTISRVSPGAGSVGVLVRGDDISFAVFVYWLEAGMAFGFALTAVKMRHGEGRRGQPTAREKNMQRAHGAWKLYRYLDGATR
jgi:hypothetical protein